MTDKPPSASTLPRAGSVRGAKPGPRARLSAAHPEGLKWTWQLGADEVVIGRRAAEGIVRLDDPTVSRRHLAIAWDAKLGAHVASDLKSRNGSWLDGAALGAAPLADNSVLRVGDVLLVYERFARQVAEDPGDVSREALPGESIATRQLRARIARAAADPSPVLLLGETGTGKEWVANELHRLSARRGKLVAINCAALSPQLVESQLFGHVRGAFTGASEAQPGLFRAADRGTLFLDEIGELPLEQQPKLLRALEESEVVPVGGADPVPVEARVIAATNRELADAVESGAFRRDLYSRLSLWEVRVPPLRERRADLFAWIGQFQRRWCEERPGSRPRPLIFSPDAAEALLLYRWPSNLRDVHRLVHELHGGGGGDGEAPIDREHLPAWVRPAPTNPQEYPPVAPPRKAIPAPTREEFEAAFQQLRGSVRALAQHFGRDRRQIYRWLSAYGIKGGSGPSR
jgi:transcriptional regulator with GAF, ATPase, and Fis domain